MAAYVTDFSSYAADAQPSDWTARWVTANNTWAVREKSGVQGGKVLENTGTVDGRHLLTWDAVDADPDRATVEVVARVRTSSSLVFQTFLTVRGSGAAGAENGYSLFFNSATNTIQLHRYLAGASAFIGTAFTIALELNTFYYVKIRANGSSISGRVWKDGDDEPNTWQVSALDSNITGPGWVGVGNVESTGVRDWDWIKVVTGGGSATLETDTSAQINVYQVKMHLMQSETPEFRMYQGKMLLAKSEVPDARVYQVKMLVAIPFGFTAGGSQQQPRTVLGF